MSRRACHALQPISGFECLEAGHGVAFATRIWRGWRRLFLHSLINRVPRLPSRSFLELGQNGGSYVRPSPLCRSRFYAARTDRREKSLVLFRFLCDLPALAEQSLRQPFLTRVMAHRRALVPRSRRGRLKANRGHVLVNQGGCLQ